MHDLIERQAAIDALTRFITPHDNGDGTMTVGVLSKSSITDILNDLPSAQPEMIREIRKWINSGNRGNADYFIVEKIEEIINKYE